MPHQKKPLTTIPDTNRHPGQNSGDFSWRFADLHSQWGRSDALKSILLGIAATVAARFFFRLEMVRVPATR